MALGTYQDVYTVEEYVSRVNEIVSETNNFVAMGLVQEMKDKVEREIEILKKREMQIYTLLKLKDKSIKGLNARIQEYKQAILALSGEKLNEEIIYVLKEKADKDFMQFKRDVNEIVEKEILPHIGEGMDNGKKAKFSDAILSFLNDGFVGGRFSSTKGMNDTANEMLLSSITPEQRKRWREKLKERHIGDIEVIETDTTDSKILNFNWLEATQNLTPTEAAKLDKKDSKTIDDINKLVMNKIVSLTDDKELVRSIITEGILNENRYAFFVGNNINDIIGICGEIQGMYYLSKLLGDANINNIKLQWKGGVINNKTGKKPHQDIVLKSFGIQIKNSLNEDFHTINFGEASISTVVQKIGVEGIEDLLTNFYGTLNFNIPYKRRGRKYIEGTPSPRSGAYKNFKTFEASYKRLQSAREQIDKLLSLCAAALMYMDIGERAGRLDANSLYLLGGDAFVAASEILTQILQELEATEHSFRVDSSFRDKANSRTIVDALNDKSRDPNYSDLVLGSMVLKSSFNFGSLKR